MSYKNPEGKKEYDRKHYQENRERLLEQVNTYRKNNPEKHKEWVENNKEKKKITDDRWRSKNKQKIREINRKRQLEGMQFLNEYKEKHGCAVCGETNPIILEFHHKNPAEKKYNVTQYYLHSRGAMLKEIAKCDVLCANHHRIADFDRRRKERSVDTPQHFSTSVGNSIHLSEMHYIHA